ncbi:hypothetical protein TPHA_0M00430 [Tetrapisispora phaffii CBS 4417]|uniref:Mtf2-like C-terminal domain-containing protein n=1 Tax=Tetrapisispora phaffii (strain ATCC 24235 / CBS 4417 / NBRC 1672 / NRRL Y-8282 / UCD 70-5) TaxID=1071381 RepID=G8C0V7_TETPH|nr:hypothetical protein TPHA_0M00430 [Tetrapisispora phaffii CBS 4417]CCE65618.1 hypothetical protein TPHA_0M00430 [Tetrapisispora phaffii CBS 4417]
MLRLRALNVSRCAVNRGIHSSNALLGEMKQSSSGKIGRDTSLDESKTFKSEEELSNIQERTLFENVFERIMEKERERELSRKDVMSQVNKLSKGHSSDEDYSEGLNPGSSNEKLQIVFGQDKKQLSENDKRMLAFFRKSSEEHNKIHDSSHYSDLATLTTDDIRKYPVSLVSTILDIDDNQAKELKMDRSILGKFAKLASNNVKKSYLPDAETTDDALNRKEAMLEYLKKKQMFKSDMDKAMKPYIDYIITQVKTDHELLEYFMELIQQYKTNADKIIPTSTSFEELPNEIKTQCEAHPTVLPTPLDITVPYIIQTFLKDEKIYLPSERRYSLSAFIHNECKQLDQLSLYLSVCSIEFYNILLQLTWENFSEIYPLRQLIGEMTINGVMGNLETINILEKIVEDLQYLNDDIAHEQPSDVNNEVVENNRKIFSNIWCRDNTIGLAKIEKYLANLKSSLA